MSKGKALGHAKAKDLTKTEAEPTPTSGGDGGDVGGGGGGGGECSCTDVKTFSFVDGGLRYSVRVFTELDENGVEVVRATVELETGHMDVNAIYWGDSNMSNDSFSLGGPLNMNGGGSLYNGEMVSWDDAVKTSDPGLGPLGESKPTYLNYPGDSYTITLGDLADFGGSLASIDYIGVRATSTNTPEGSIKGVSICEDNGDDNGNGDPDPDPDCEFKVIFYMPNHVEFVYSSELDSGIEDPTLQDYYNHMLTKIDEDNVPVDDMTKISVYRVDADRNIIGGVEREYTDPDDLDALRGLEANFPLPCCYVDEIGGCDANEDPVDEDHMASVWA